MPSFSISILATAALAAAQTTLIPTDCFSSQSAFDQYFSYDYPWNSDTHNGGARMSSEQCSLSSNTLTETAIYDPSQPDVEDLPINYRSCAVYANQHFVVEEGSGLDFEAEFIAPVAKGTWPAFWLTGTEGWPPEIDMVRIWWNFLRRFYTAIFAFSSHFGLGGVEGKRIDLVQYLQHERPGRCARSRVP